MIQVFSVQFSVGKIIRELQMGANFVVYKTLKFENVYA